MEDGKNPKVVSQRWARKYVLAEAAEKQGTGKGKCSPVLQPAHLDLSWTLLVADIQQHLFQSANKET